MLHCRPNWPLFLTALSRVSPGFAGWVPAARALGSASARDGAGGAWDIANRWMSTIPAERLHKSLHVVGRRHVLVLPQLHAENAFSHTRHRLRRPLDLMDPLHALDDTFTRSRM